VSPRKSKTRETETAAEQTATPAAPAQATATQATPEPATHEPATAAPVTTAVAAAPPVAGAREARGARTLTGRVVSSKMRKTIAVEIERLVKHPAYGKYVRRTTKLLAHDEDGASHEGDLVTITPCRPMSRRKSWRLLEVVKAAGR